MTPSGNTRFAPNNFQYNGRVALALLPCLITSAIVGGSSVVACLTIGAMVVYLMDALQYREGAFTCAWLTLAFSTVAFSGSLLIDSDAPVILTSFMLIANLLLCILTGMWASLQFKWIQMQYPAAAIVFERCVLTASVPIAAVMHTLGLATFVPYTDVPYYLAIIMAVLYATLGRPLVSSFYNTKAGGPALGGGSTVGPEAIVQTRMDGVLLASLAAVLPPVAYASIHWVVLGHSIHVYSLLLLAALLPVHMALLPGGLWWLERGAGVPASVAGGAPAPLTGVVRLVRDSILVAALLIGLIGFEGRVVFHGFGQYIKLPPPFNWLAVTFALFGSALVGVLHLTGALGSSVDVTVAGSFLLLCTTAGALAAGVPFHWLPAPLVAACGLSLFYESRSLREYLVFVIGAFLTGMWFVRHHFWFLDILVSGMHLHTICKMVLAAMVPALCVPGLVVANASHTLIGGMLLFQAALLCIVEERMYAAGHEEAAPEIIYPGYLVVATSVLGIVIARVLTARGRLTPLVSWLLHSLYAAKLSMLALPEAYLVLPMSLLLAAVLAPYFFYGASLLHNCPSGHSGALLAVAAPSPMGAPTSRARRLRLAPWQGLAHILAVFVCALLSRFAVFDVVQFAIAARPTEGLLMGALILTFALGLLPLATHCYNNTGLLARGCMALVLCGLLLIVLQPPLPLGGGARCPRLPLSLCPRLWDERHVPMHSAEDVEIWGIGLSRREHWPRWLLIAAVVAGIAATGSSSSATVAVSLPTRPGVKTIAARLLFALVSGLLVGAYTALELFPDQLALQVLTTITSVLVVVFVVLLSLPKAAGPLVLPALAVVWGTASGLALLLHAELPVPMRRADLRLFPDSRVSVETELYLATKASLLAVVASHALLMAFGLKLKMSSALRQKEAASERADHRHAGVNGSGYGVPVSDLFCGVVPSSVFSRFGTILRVEGAGGLALQRLAAEGLAWVPSLGNLFTIVAVVLGLALNGFMTNGAAEAIFMIAPVLLLLSQDPLLLPFLLDRQRYFPPQAAISVYLLLTGLYACAMDARAAAQATGVSLATYLLLNVLTTVVAVPHHVMFLDYLWTGRPRQRGTVLALLLAPVCLLPVFLSSVLALRFFGAVGAVVGVLQYFSMKHVRHMGMKVI